LKDLLLLGFLGKKYEEDSFDRNGLTTYGLYDDIKECHEKYCS
jgi:hypothetical protein